MAEIEETDLAAPLTPRKRAEWLLNVFIRPARAMREIACEERAVWAIPMILLTVLTLVFVAVAGPLRQQAALSAPAQPPENFQYMSPEQQQQYMAAQASASGSTQTYVFPAVGGVVGVWLSWFVLGGLLHLILTMLGSRSTNTTAFNLVAWASLPFAIREIVRIVAMLTTHQLIASPGLSGFLAGNTKDIIGFARIVLSMVDIYLVWQILLLWIGASSTSGLTRGKAFSGVLITLLVLLALAAVPGFLSLQISGLSIDRPFFLF